MGRLQCGQRCFTLNQRRKQSRWQGLPHPVVQCMSGRVESSNSRQMGQTSVGSAVRRGTRDLQPANQTTSPFRQDATEMAKVQSKTKVHSTVHSTESNTIVSRAWRSEAFKTGCCSSGASKADQTANVRLEKRLGAASAMSPTLGLLMARAEVPKMPRHSHGIMPATGFAQSPSTHAMAICCAYSGDHSAMAFIASTRHHERSSSFVGRGRETRPHEPLVCSVHGSRLAPKIRNMFGPIPSPEWLTQRGVPNPCTPPVGATVFGVWICYYLLRSNYSRSRSRSFAIPARRTTSGPVETHRGGRNLNYYCSTMYSSL